MKAGDTGSSVLSERVGDLLVCTFSATSRLNVLNADVVSTWLGYLDRAAQDSSVKAVITAAHGRAWCAGADFDLLAKYSGADDRDPSDGLTGLAHELLGGTAALTGLETPWDVLGLNHLARYLSSYPKPMVAAIDGAVAGGGVPLALLHDIRVVTPEATFRTSFPRLGLVSEMGMISLLVRMVGMGRATDICMTGRVVSAWESVEIGLTQRLVDTDHLLAEAVNTATALAEGVTPACDLRRMLRVETQRPWHDYLAEEWSVQRAAFDRPATRGAIASAIKGRGTS